MLDIVPAAPTPMTLPQAVADIEARIARAPIRTKPFPHIIIDDVLPGAVRQSLDKFWPTADQLKASNYFQRNQLRIAALAESTQGREQQFWAALRHVTVPMGRAVRHRLARHLSEKFRPLIGPNWRRKLGKTPFSESDALLAEYNGVVDLLPDIDPRPGGGQRLRLSRRSRPANTGAAPRHHAVPIARLRLAVEHLDPLRHPRRLPARG
ncbi:hypothetical protein BAL199_20410 [alpha proteobacterium BAL199]|nr:hypothetical protein BAL199_20410 [alpha proteobacterium BAL199]